MAVATSQCAPEPTVVRPVPGARRAQAVVLRWDEELGMLRPVQTDERGAE